MSRSEISPVSLRPYQKLGRWLGPAVFLIMLLLASYQDTMSVTAWRVAAVGLWMAIWWATEALPVAATAFLPIVAFEPLGIAGLREAAAPYANPIIYLFLGGFLMALAVERWNLHRRIALVILRRTGTEGRRLALGFMAVCAALSMWMTNTSTTMMLLPIVLSVIAVIGENVPNLSDRDREHFQIAMLLGLAYAATIGGLATLVGTPPNALLAGYMNEQYGVTISFARWMAVGIPVTLVMLPLAWLALTRVLFPFNVPASQAVSRHLEDLRTGLGPMSAAEKRVAVLFALVIAGWMLGRPLAQWIGFSGLSDPGIVMAAALALFVLPSGDADQPQLMIWRDAARLPWGVLILFGGGLSLAAAVSDSGLALWLGESLAGLSTLGQVVLVAAAVTLVIFLTELTSNLATTATLLPVMGAIALQTGIDPLVLAVPVTLAASCAFMLPVATPPNAIVFATERLTIPQMARAGIALNLLGVILVTMVALILAPAVLL